jgi:anaerobic magnesium-protoporphyrin IX monomethyl ester cyclase
MFWKRWRHRRVTAFVDEMEWLCREKGVRFFWIADENPTTLKDVWRQVLEEIDRRQLGVGMCASIRAQDIVRDADLLPLYRAAGFVYVLMGIETVTDETLARVRKGGSVDDGYQAVRLLRQHGILSIVDYIFGLEEETPRTLWRGLLGLHRYDGDFVNALYVTPHSWTPLGTALQGAERIEDDQWKWDYRHQVLAVKGLTPGQLFAGVKLIELLYHLHPRRLWRVLAAPDRAVRRHLRFAYRHITAVYWYEVFEFLKSRWGGATPRRRPESQRVASGALMGG